MIDPTDAIDLLTKLVSISLAVHPRGQSSAYLAGWMNAHGFKAHVDEAHNAVGCAQRRAGNPCCWPHRYLPRRSAGVPRGRCTYGRGSVDAKGPLCSLPPPPPRWMFRRAGASPWGAVERRPATSKGARHILSQRLAQPPVYCLIGEPSHWDRVTLGYKGRLVMDVTLRVPFSPLRRGGPPARRAGGGLVAGGQSLLRPNRTRRGGRTRRLPGWIRPCATSPAAMRGVWHGEMSLGFRLPGALNRRRWRRICGGCWPNYRRGLLPRLLLAGRSGLQGDKSNPLVRPFYSHPGGGGDAPLCGQNRHRRYERGSPALAANAHCGLRPRRQQPGSHPA